MRILLIDVNCKYNSTGKLVYDIYNNLNDSGHTAAICYGRGLLVKEPNVFKFGLDLETIFHAVLTRLSGYTGCFSYFSTRRLIRYIEGFHPDIVHIHEMHAYFLNIGMLLRYLYSKKIKTIFTLHCEFNYTGKCGHSYECNKWKDRCGKCPHLSDYPRVLLFDHTKFMHAQKERLFSNFKDSIITTPSPWLSERVSMSFLKNNPIYTILNGVDKNIFRRKNSNSLREQFQINGKKIIVSVAPNIMSKEKGGQFLVDIAKILHEYIFILVGTDGKRIEINDNVILVPIIKNTSELVNYYSLADLFALCSMRETFSLTCAEALLCGVPIVGFCCGAPEMIFEEPYAKFVPYGDTEQLIKQIQTSKSLEVGAIRTYGMKFSKDQMINNYCDLYYKEFNSIVDAKSLFTLPSTNGRNQCSLRRPKSKLQCRLL